MPISAKPGLTPAFGANLFHSLVNPLLKLIERNIRERSSCFSNELLEPPLACILASQPGRVMGFHELGLRRVAGRMRSLRSLYSFLVLLTPFSAISNNFRFICTRPAYLHI